MQAFGIKASKSKVTTTGSTLTTRTHLDLAEVRRVRHTDGALDKATAALNAVVLDAMLLAIVLLLLQGCSTAYSLAGNLCASSTMDEDIISTCTHSCEALQFRKQVPESSLTSAQLHCGMRTCLASALMLSTSPSCITFTESFDTPGMSALTWNSRSLCKGMASVIMERALTCSAIQDHSTLKKHVTSIIQHKALLYKLQAVLWCAPR